MLARITALLLAIVAACGAAPSDVRAELPPIPLYAPSAAQRGEITLPQDATRRDTSSYLFTSVRPYQTPDALQPVWQALGGVIRLDRIRVNPRFDWRRQAAKRGDRKNGPRFAMVGFRARLGTEVSTEVWCELGGLELLDHSMAVGSSFRPLDVLDLF